MPVLTPRSWAMFEARLHRVDPNLLILMLAPAVVVGRLGVPFVAVLWVICLGFSGVAAVNAVFYLVRGLLVRRCCWDDLILGMFFALISAAFCSFPL